MSISERAAQQVERLAVERLGLGEAASLAKALGQVVHLGAEDFPVALRPGVLQAMADVVGGLVKLAQVVVDDHQVCQVAPDSVDVAGALAHFESLAHRGDGLASTATAEEALAQLAERPRQVEIDAGAAHRPPTFDQALKERDGPLVVSL